MSLGFNSLFEIARSESNAWPALVRNAKIMEEVGEFSEALLHKLGYLPHKIMKEPIEGEAADIIICVIDTLASAYPDLTPTQLTDMITHQLGKKSQKWVTVMGQRSEKNERAN